MFCLPYSACFSPPPSSSSSLYFLKTMRNVAFNCQSGQWLCLGILIYLRMHVYQLINGNIESTNRVAATQCIKACRRGHKVQLFKPNIRMVKKCDLSDFDCKMIVGAKWGGLSISATANSGGRFTLIKAMGKANAKVRGERELVYRLKGVNLVLKYISWERGVVNVNHFWTQCWKRNVSTLLYCC